jgi:hypothetical protein
MRVRAGLQEPCGLRRTRPKFKKNENERDGSRVVGVREALLLFAISVKTAHVKKCSEKLKELRK